jgi:hypothetical protein
MLCVIFACVSWRAARTKSATMDEPSHAMTGWLMLYRRDYRLSPDVPPLWEKWIALASNPNAIHFDAASPQYAEFKVRRNIVAWVVQTLYRTPGNDGLQLVNRARAMALILGVILAALIARWAWELAGPVAAVIATFLYCLDPNFLGHAALAKNDVAGALCYCAAAYAIFRAGRRLTWLNALAVGALIAAGILVKFSGLLMIPVLLLALLFRVLSPTPWLIGARSLAHRNQKALAALLLCTTTAIICYVSLWAAYGFRFNAGPDGRTLDMSVIVDRLRVHQQAADHQTPTSSQIPWQPPLTTRIMLFGERHHLIPQAFAYGFVFVQSGDQGSRDGFILNQRYSGGKWYYFPLAAVLKAPLATTLAAMLAMGIAIAALAGRKPLFADFRGRWAAVAITFPAAIYGIVAMTSQINIGVRHIFPIIPFAFIAISIALARLWQGKGKLILLSLAVLLAAEDASSFPNYIGFFNFILAPHRVQLLSDSNLDWGQDLPLLAAWQHNHPDTPLYFEYFGQCDPAVYGIRYINGPGGYAYGPPPQMPRGDGVLALSASLMQNNYFDDRSKWAVWGLSPQSKPDKILGGSIYLFKLNLPQNGER